MKGWCSTGGFAGAGILGLGMLFLDSRGVVGALAVVFLLFALSGMALCLSRRWDGGDTLHR